MPRLTDEPDVIKFSRLDVMSYEGDWDPEKYDPYLAKATLDDHIEEAVEAEKLGWDGYMITEHHHDGWTLAPSPNIMLTAIAARTKRIRLGHAVQVLPVHDPFFLAEEYGMLDMLSGGRLEVGLGRGNFDFEWDRYEEDKENAAALFDDNLEHLMKALTTAQYTHQGVHPIPKPTTMYPRPLQEPLPIWLAGTSPASCARAGAEGHNLLSVGFSDGGARLKAYVEAAAEAGHVRSGANMSVLIKVICAPTDHEAQQINERLTRVLDEGPIVTRGLRDTDAGRLHLGGFTGGIIGSPATVLAQLTELLGGSGARRLLLIVRLRGLPGEASRQTQRLLAEEVFPHLRHFPDTYASADSSFDELSAQFAAKPVR